MTSFRCFVLFLFLLIFCPSDVFAYKFYVREKSIDDPLLTRYEVGRVLAFEILKLSLSKNNISNDLDTVNGIGGGETVGGVSGLGAVSGGNNPEPTIWCVVWPRSDVKDGACLCDYAIFGYWYKYYYDYQGTGYNREEYYIYGDVGVVNTVNYIGATWNTPYNQKSVSIAPYTNTMPLTLNDSGNIYFEHPTRFLNLTQTGSSDDVSVFKYGSIAELFSSQLNMYYLGIYGGSEHPNGTTANLLDRSFSMRTKNTVLQSHLPWQLQLNNPDFNETNHTKPNSAYNADTDLGTEPDISEYYNGHDYLNDPEDDWGQPANIGGGGGVGGEITGFSSGAQTQMTNSIESALGDGQLDTSLPDADAPTVDRDDPAGSDYWLTDVQSGVDDILPDGVSRFKSLVDRLKNPDLSSIDPIVIPIEVDLRSIGGSIYFENEEVEFDWNILLNNDWYDLMVLARYVVVFVMFGFTVIYIVKDNFLLGQGSNNGD